MLLGQSWHGEIGENVSEKAIVTCKYKTTINHTGQSLKCSLTSIPSTPINRDCEMYDNHFMTFSVGAS
jgi:hypothetical protein